MTRHIPKNAQFDWVGDMLIMSHDPDAGIAEPENLQDDLGERPEHEHRPKSATAAMWQRAIDRANRAG